LWEIGAAQTDGANLTAANIDWKNHLLSYHRQKPANSVCLNRRATGIALKKLSSEGALFLNIRIER